MTVESIKLRYTPSTEAVIAGTVERGELVEIAYTLVADGFGPVEADGFVWYPVSLLNMTEMPELGTQRGYTGEILWMSVGNGTESWVERVAPRCIDGDPDLATLESMFDFERIACFGDRQITVEGVFGCGGCGGFLPGTFEPAGWRRRCSTASCRSTRRSASAPSSSTSCPMVGSCHRVPPSCASPVTSTTRARRSA